MQNGINLTKILLDMILKMNQFWQLINITEIKS